MVHVSAQVDAAGEDPERVGAPGAPRAVSQDKGRQIGLLRTVASVALDAILAAALVWQFTGVADDGMQIQVLDPGLAVLWKAALMVPLLADALIVLSAWRIGRWTRGLMRARAFVTAGAVLLVVGLLFEGALLVPGLLD